MEKIVSEKQMLDVLDILYNKALNGIPNVSKPLNEFVEDYMYKYDRKVEKCADDLIKYQIMKCGTSGFLTGLGGIITLPVAIPANVSSVLYVQMRMIAATAMMGGYDVDSDQVQTMVYLCLTGSAMADIAKRAGIQIGEKMATAAIKKIPGKVLVSINQKVGFRLFTKFGTKGAVNFVKMVPVVGGVIGGGIDVGTTKIIGTNAYNLFINGKIEDKNTREYERH